MPDEKTELSAGQLRRKFEQTVSGLKAVRFSLKRDDDGEYRQGAVFHMWTGYCLSALDNGLAKRNEHGFIDDY